MGSGAVGHTLAQQVLHLNQHAHEATRMTSAHVLDQSTSTSILYCYRQHGLVFLHRRLRQPLAQVQYLSNLCSCSIECGLHFGFRQ